MRRFAIAAVCALGGVLSACATTIDEPAAALEPSWSFALHGGAGVIARGSMTPEREAEYRRAMSQAATVGASVLADGGSSLDAVVAAIRVLEDDANFNAGKGAVFSAAGRNEMDASIMYGADRSAGAVAGVTRAKNPILAARAVMELSPHVMLSGDGAEVFLESVGVELVDPSYFHTDRRWRQLQERLARASRDENWKYGTVGAVARDQIGRAHV